MVLLCRRKQNDRLAATTILLLIPGIFFCIFNNTHLYFFNNIDLFHTFVATEHQSYFSNGVENPRNVGYIRIWCEIIWLFFLDLISWKPPASSRIQLIRTEKIFTQISGRLPPVPITTMRRPMEFAVSVGVRDRFVRLLFVFSITRSGSKGHHQYKWPSVEMCSFYYEVLSKHCFRKPPSRNCGCIRFLTKEHFFCLNIYFHPHPSNSLSYFPSTLTQCKFQTLYHII